MYCGGAATTRPASVMIRVDAIVVYHGQYGRLTSRSSVDTLGDFTLYAKDLQEDAASLLYNVSGWLKHSNSGRLSSGNARVQI